MGALQEFTKGIWRENPVFKLVLGMCPVLAVTTSGINGLGMGLASTFVLLGSNMVISLLRKLIPKKVRIPAFIVVIASFVTIVDLVMDGFFHDLHKSLGLFIPLIVVNCIILGRAEAFASRHPLRLAILDGLGMGFGFTLALVVLGVTREFLGAGTVFEQNVLGEGYTPFLLMILPPGAFLALGIYLGLLNKLEMWLAARSGRAPRLAQLADCRTCALCHIEPPEQPVD
ncbi:MAG: electron transport complex subunit E [Acidobacteria bacterium]|nr:electron transport complex subunit E [Acidobacteriota bacterium]